jgi:hypothetical protein
MVALACPIRVSRHELAPYCLLVHRRRARPAGAFCRGGLDLVARRRDRLTQTKSLVKTQRGNIDRVKELLGDQIAVGEQLIRRLNIDHLDQDQTRAEEWAAKTHDLIGSAHGSGEAAIFLSNANYVFYGEGGQYSLVKNFIDCRLRWLTELIPRTDTLPLRGGFDPDTWAKAHPSQPQ